MHGWDGGITSATLWQGPAEKVIRLHIWTEFLEPSALAAKGKATSGRFIVTDTDAGDSGGSWLPLVTKSLDSTETNYNKKQI